MDKLQNFISPSKLALIEPIINKYPKYQNQIINFIIIHCKKSNTNNTSLKYNRFFVDINSYKFSDDISKILGIIIPKYNFDNETGLFGKCSDNYDLINTAVDEIKNNGFYKFDITLDDNACNNIIDSLSTLKYYTQQKKEITGINLQNPISSSHWVKNQQDVSNIKEIQQLITDPTILSICQNYLNTIPINFQTNAWWSCKYGVNDGTHSFHQDFEDLKFIKIFIYLNDINENNGPHVYAKSSRNNLVTPTGKYSASTRVSEKFVRDNYEVLDLTGKKGTLLFVDTNGYHKGKKLLSGYRILTQIEYGASYMFNQISIPSYNIDYKTDQIKKIINKYNKIYYKYM